MKLSLLCSTSTIMMACAIADTEEWHKNWHNKWHNDHHKPHNKHGGNRPCYNGYDKVCIHPDCDKWGYSDDENAACGKAWYCDDNVSVWGWSEKDFDANEVHCGCSQICYKTVWHGAKRWECCDDEEDEQMDKQEKMLRGAEEDKLSTLKSE